MPPRARRHFSWLVIRSGLGRLDLAGLDAAAFSCLAPGSDALAGEAEDRSPVCPFAENA